MIVSVTIIPWGEVPAPFSVSEQTDHSTNKDRSDCVFTRAVLTRTCGPPNPLKAVLVLVWVLQHRPTWGEGDGASVCGVDVECAGVRA